MQRVERIEHDRGRTGAGEGRGDFAADVAGFPDPEDDHFAARFDRRFDQLDGAGEIFVRAVAATAGARKFRYRAHVRPFQGSPSMYNCGPRGRSSGQEIAWRAIVWTQEKFMKKLFGWLACSLSQWPLLHRRKISPPRAHQQQIQQKQNTAAAHLPPAGRPVSFPGRFAAAIRCRCSIRARPRVTARPRKA